MAISERTASLCYGVLDSEPGVEELIADRVGFVLGVGGISVCLAGFGFVGDVEEGNGDLDADGGVVLLEAEVVVLQVVELCEAAVLGLENDLRSPEVAALSEGDLTLGTRVGVGRLDGGAEAD
ncbi:hypothetical protein RBB78_17595 [Tunturiibacter empetritectus]